jgi:hypothetical protein
MKLVLALFALALSTSIVSHAQTRIQFYSSIAKTGPVPVECSQESAVIRPMIAEFHGPANWTWIIACDEKAWNQVEVHAGMSSDSHGQILGLTNLENHMTYIRGYAILHPFNDSTEAQPTHTIAHEIGHILTNSSNENKAERKANELLKNSSQLLAQN